MNENRDDDRDEDVHPRPDLAKLGEFLSGPVDVRSLALTGTFVLLLFYTLYLAKPVFLPIVIAILLNFLLNPAVRGLARLRIPNGIGAALVLLFLLGVAVVGAYRLSGPATEWVDKAPRGLRRAEARIRDLQRPVQEVQRAVEEVEEQAQQMTNGGDRTQQVQVQGTTLTGTIMNRTQAFFAEGILMLVLLYFMLASGDLFLRKLVRVLPRLRDKKRAIEIARSTERHISSYLATVTLINMGLAVVVALAMRLVGMPNPILWGVLAGVLNYIPYIGPLVTASIIALVSILSFEDLGRAFVAPVVYYAINFLEGSFVTPMLLARRLTLNPVVIFIALMFWGWLWGLPGALLAVPLLGMFKIFCDHIEPLAPIGEFLGR